MSNMLNLDRQILARFLPNHQSILAFERMQSGVNEGLPSTIEEANALAGQALAAAQAALSMLAVLADALSQLGGAPAPVPPVDPDDHAPRAQLGTISPQNHDAVEITGGSIDGTAIGTTTAAAGKFTALAASQQITSTVAPGTPPLVIASTDKVVNLYVDRAALADTATALTLPSAFPAAATDLPTVITLANALRTAAITKGL